MDRMDTQQTPKKWDLLIQGGWLLDPSQNLDEPMDVAVCDGMIACVGRQLPAEQARRIIRADGLHVVPGLIDLHTHLYPLLPRPEGCLAGVDGQAHLFQSGITTAVDAGSTGYRDFVFFRQAVLDTSPVRLFAFLNIACGGMVDGPSEQRIADMNPDITAAMARTHADKIVGIKTAHYWCGPQPFDAEHPPWASVDAAVDAGERCHMPVMADFHPKLPERPYPDLILKKLRPGDLHTHVYAQQFPHINEEGKPFDYLFEARKRGVLFDLGHGAASFWFRNAVRSLEGGFPPDTISTDLHMGNIHGAVLSLVHVMSKYLAMGMPLADIIRKTTMEPARVIGHPELGTLRAGSCADIALLAKQDGPFRYADCGGAGLTGEGRLECRMTLRAGKVVFDSHGVTAPDWQTAPEAYWTSPGFIR